MSAVLEVGVGVASEPRISERVKEQGHGVGWAGPHFGSSSQRFRVVGSIASGPVVSQNTLVGATTRAKRRRQERTGVRT